MAASRSSRAPRRARSLDRSGASCRDAGAAGAAPAGACPDPPRWARGRRFGLAALASWKGGMPPVRMSQLAHSRSQLPISSGSLAQAASWSCHRSKNCSANAASSRAAPASREARSPIPGVYRPPPPWTTALPPMRSPWRPAKICYHIVMGPVCPSGWFHARYPDAAAAAGHDQEIRQPPPLQHGELELCDARQSVPDGEGEYRLRGDRCQDRRGSDALGPDPDYRRGGEQRTEPPADQLPAPAHRLLRRQYAMAGAELSRIDNEDVRQEPGADAHLPAAGARWAVSLRLLRGGRQAEHGDDRAGDEDVHALRRRSGRIADAIGAARLAR